MEVELPLESRPLKTLNDVELQERDVFSSLKDTNGCNGHEYGTNGLNDNSNENVNKKQDLTAEEKLDSLNIPSEDIPFEDMPSQNEIADNLPLDNEKIFEFAEDNLLDAGIGAFHTIDAEGDSEVISSTVNNLSESAEDQILNGVEGEANEETESAEVVPEQTNVEVTENLKETTVAEMKDIVNDNLRCQRLNDEQQTPQVDISSPLPGPSRNTRLDTPYPFERISGRKGLRDAEGNSSFAVRSAPTTPSVLNFPRLRKFAGYDALNITAEASRKKRRALEDLEVPTAKRTRENSWLEWVNPLRWLFSGEEKKTETVDSTEEDMLKDIKEVESPQQEEQALNRSCNLM